MKEALATVGPVSIAIDVTEEKFMLYKDGVFVDPTCANGKDDLNHGVLVVGYGTDSSDGESHDYWIVKNRYIFVLFFLLRVLASLLYFYSTDSWGTTWGESGYIRMARNNSNMCGVATAACYPLVKADL